MKFTKESFDLVISKPKYEGADTYLLDDQKNKIDYHIYLCLIESGNVACIICEPMPYLIYEFNGNKLLEHNVVRIKELDKNTAKFKLLMSRFINKEYN